MEKKSNHRVNIVRVHLDKHPNADSLSLVKVDGYQVVVRTEDWKDGDLGVYVQPDSVVPQTEPFKFLWVGVDPETFVDGIVPEKRRRITVRKFRKEWSEGLLMPLREFYTQLVGISGDYDAPQEGDDVSNLLGITHYEPPEDTGESSQCKAKSRWPRSTKGWFYFFINGFLRLFGIERWGVLGGSNDDAPGPGIPEYDVDAYKNHLGKFIEGEEVIVTEKINGSNARYIWNGKKMYAGSRKLWKSPKASCIWRKALDHNPWIELWCRAHKDSVLYGEVVPTQKEPFDYGCEPGQARFFVFDVLKSDKTWATWEETEDTRKMCNWVPLLYKGPFNEDVIKSFVDGDSHVLKAKHIREGVVIKPINERHEHGLGRLQLKIVSNRYLELN